MGRLGLAAPYLLVTPIRDEIDLISDLVATVRAQEHPPTCWLLVDDGSTDGTDAELARLADREPWVTLVRMPPGPQDDPDRYSRVVSYAFEAVAELAEAEGLEYEFVANLDADVRPSPALLAELIARASADRMAGITSCRLVRVREDGRPVPLAQPLGGGPRSGIRVWSRGCVEDVASYYTPHWAAVTCVRARNRGYDVVVHEDLDAEVVRPDGMRAGWWSGYRKFGASVWQVGVHPAVLAVEAMRESARDRDLRGVAMVVGYLESALRRKGRCHDAEVVSYFRDDLPRQRLGALAQRWWPRGRGRS